MRVPTLVLASTLFLSSAARADQPFGGPGLSGRWSGYWVSDKNGHTGPLRANFRKVSDACYRVTFTGRFWKVVPFVYSVNLAVTGTTGDAVTLAGETRAGPVIGTFRYDATATACEFEARFTSKNDSGRFVLTR
ncbi:MAG TPA: hypothetical protein VM533_19005 [Fimbriiglobus sp.]|jgi:hypothetical protein|nr:hypothetical protein [Fimbriiglobus sp.]